MSLEHSMLAPRLLRGALFGVSLATTAPTVHANPLLHDPGMAGFVVLAEQRFNPAVQRYMAEQSLRALPLRDGQLFYVYPTDTSRAHLEEMQIRFLEVLLHERREQKNAEGKPASSEPVVE